MIANEPAVEKNYRLNKSNKRNAHFRKQSLAGCRSVLPISTSHDYFWHGKLQLPDQTGFFLERTGTQNIKKRILS